MPEKPKQLRAKRAKAEGTTMALKVSDTGRAPTAKSAHALKKSRGVVGRARFEDRSVDEHRPPGKGKTAQSIQLPVPETGSSTSRRKTIPDEAAAQYRHGQHTRARVKSPTALPHDKHPESLDEERPKRSLNEAKLRHEVRSKRGSPVKGRKKPPSEMDITHRGGPRKRMPIHGG
ncbi:hypothetical protein [Vitiosangium sp. GDMCC 1.1324]|uniref:hypothetical protein n=1 Tax=Vitiosangium sp. (strain GDMCC 1.1324) TaxID=2138576 RepID=UPI000D3B4916|nr:hypothetical protein [Vitiosangium sp. GDMCC 1.1324]PTL83326.1 hypothetical protein DAT35_15185 [Vitiosangium sp. GDMCC 1.1324]